MSRVQASQLRESVERKSLRRHVARMHRAFNEQKWQQCFELLDPQLVKRSRVDQGTYSASLSAFHTAYGSIRPWFVRISLHLDGAKSGDNRPFAYVYVIWQDAAHAFHMFKERWVKEGDKWHSRVVGLVPNQAEARSLAGAR